MTTPERRQEIQSVVDGAAGPASGARIADRYVVERELGRGGMAVVYLARDLRHDRHVAVKVLDAHVAPMGAERFLREIRIATRLTHPHVLGVHDSGESDGRLFYVMPYVAGETLRSRLTRDGALPLADALRLLRELADAMAYAHGHGVIHRDLKPENVLLSGGHAVVADFGIAKAIVAATAEVVAPNDKITATGVAIGTPAYMAPEQVVGDATMDHRADLYALGLIAYEMVTGVHPFAGRTSQALAKAHLVEAPPNLAKQRSDLPPELSALVTQLLGKDPSIRPQSAIDVVRVLDGLAPTTGGSAARKRRRAPSRAMIATVAVAILAAAAASYYRVSDTTERTGGMVAVLPFTTIGGSPDDEYFSDGLTDELTHALAQIPGLKLAGHDASYAFKGRHVAAQEVGRVLTVRAFVSATVRRSGDRLRVNPQLVSTANGRVLWDSVYESRSGDVFAVQDSLTRAVVAALVPALGIRGRDPRNSDAAHPVTVDVRRGTKDAEAYELYLRGMYYWHERGLANVARSISYFQQAIARDPTFARAYAGLTFAYNVLEVYAPDPADSTTPLVEASARRAMMLDSTLADAQLAMAMAASRNGRFAEEEKRYRAALRIEPSNQFVHHAFGSMLLVTGRTEEALAELTIAAQLDPLAKSAGTALAEAYINARRFGEAEAEARRILAIDSTFSLGLYSLGGAQAFGGQPDSAVRTLERGVRLYPQVFSLQTRLFYAYAASGRWDDVERRRAQLRAPGGDRTGGVLAGFADLVLGDREPLMRVITAQGDSPRLFGLLRKAGAGPGCNPLFDPLWADERFRAAMRRFGVAPCAVARPWPLPPRRMAR